MTPPAAEQQALDAAVDWRVRQESGRFGEDDRQALERWLAAAPHHRRAWERVCGPLGAPLAGPLDTVRAFQQRGDSPHAQAAAQALARPRRRRVIRGALAVAGIGGGAGLVADRISPLAGWSADLHTRTGERREFTLAGGTAVLLDARSAADAPAPGRLRLRAGALIASHAPAAGAPLEVRTPHAGILCEHGRFLCRLAGPATEVVALEQALVIQPHAGGPPIRLRPGEGQRLTAAASARLPGDAAKRAAWRDGMLAAEDWPLGEVVEALRAYSPGFIRVSEAAAAVRVFGIFRLDVEEALQTLAYTRPVQVRRLGPWLVAIDLDARRAAAG